MSKTNSFASPRRASYLRYLETLSLVSLNFSMILPKMCLMRPNYFMQLVLATTLPLVVSWILLLYALFQRLRGGRWDHAYSRVKTNLASPTLVEEASSKNNSAPPRRSSRRSLRKQSKPPRNLHFHTDLLVCAYPFVLRLPDRERDHFHVVWLRLGV